MRPIKFRAKTLNEGEWVYGMTIGHGTISRKKDNLYMEVAPDKWKGINPDTIGQFSGLYDKNGKEIYEGDIIHYGELITNVVTFRHGAFGYLILGGEFISYAGNRNFTFNPLNRSNEHEVIGNIHDNPEMLSTLA